VCMNWHSVLKFASKIVKEKERKEYACVCTCTHGLYTWIDQWMHAFVCNDFLW
jgi:hypothetical protein